MQRDLCSDRGRNMEQNMPVTGIMLDYWPAAVQKK